MFSIKLNFVSAGKAQLLEPLKTQFGEVHRFFVWAYAKYKRLIG